MSRVEVLSDQKKFFIQEEVDQYVRCFKKFNNGEEPIFVPIHFTRFHERMIGDFYMYNRVSAHSITDKIYTHSVMFWGSDRRRRVCDLRNYNTIGKPYVLIRYADYLNSKFIVVGSFLAMTRIRNMKRIMVVADLFPHHAGLSYEGFEAEATRHIDMVARMSEPRFHSWTLEILSRPNADDPKVYVFPALQDRTIVTGMTYLLNTEQYIGTTSIFDPEYNPMNVRTIGVRIQDALSMPKEVLDLFAYAELQTHRSFTDTKITLLPDGSVAYDTDVLRRDLSIWIMGEYNRTILLFVDDRVVGLIRYVSEYCQYTEIYSLYIKEEYRKQGIGSWTITELINDICPKGVVPTEPNPFDAKIPPNILVNMQGELLNASQFFTMHDFTLCAFTVKHDLTDADYIETSLVTD